MSMLLAKKMGLPAIAFLTAILGLSSVQTRPAAESRDSNAWFRVCAALPRPMEVDACFTHKELFVSGFESAIGAVGILSYKGTNKLLAMFPFDGAPPEGVDVDGGSPVRFEGSSCGAVCCFAKSAVDTSFVNKMKSGLILHYRVPDITGTSLVIPVTLPGFLNPTLLKRGPDEARRLTLLKPEIFEKCLADIIY